MHAINLFRTLEGQSASKPFHGVIDAPLAVSQDEFMASIADPDAFSDAELQDLRQLLSDERSFAFRADDGFFSDHDLARLIRGDAMDDPGGRQVARSS